MPYVIPMVNVSLSLHPSLMLLNSANKTNMLILHKEDHGCVYTLGEENELFYAPIYTDNTINLNEFHPVDLADVDDEYEVLDIQNELIAALSNVRY
jgi:hypothetical protein